MRYGWLAWGIAAGLALAVVGLGLRTLMVDFPLEGLFMRMTHALGVPTVFNYVHELLGYGPLAKNLAFAGSLGIWLGVHPALVAGYRVLGVGAVVAAFAFYTAFSDWSAGLIYAGLFWSIALLAWWDRPAARLDLERRESIRFLAAGALAVGGIVGGLRFVRGWLVAGAGGAGPAEAGGVASPADGPRPTGAGGGTAVAAGIPGLSPAITPQADLYYVSKNPDFLDPRIVPGDYMLRVDGLVDRPAMLGLDQLRALPSVDLVNTLMCISNPIGGTLIGTPRWTGVPLRALLDRVGVRPEARWLVSEAADDYVESIPLTELPPEAMVAYAVNGEDLYRKHGYPTRLLIPGRYGMKQPKWLVRLSLAETAVPGYWAERGWSRTAVVRTMSRIDTPADGSSLRAGSEVTVAGIGFAGGRRLQRIEISFDGGRSWRAATLEPALSPFAWRRWVYRWRPESPGRQTLMVRAVEADGGIQEAARSPALPDGATGYHTITVAVATSSAG